MPVVGQYCARCGVHHVRLGPRYVTRARLVAVSLTVDGHAPEWGGVQGYRTLVCPGCGEVDRREGDAAP